MAFYQLMPLAAEFPQDRQRDLTEREIPEVTGTGTVRGSTRFWQISEDERHDETQNEHYGAAFQVPPRARVQKFAQDHAQVEHTHKSQLPIQNVLPSPQGGTTSTRG